MTTQSKSKEVQQLEGYIRNYKAKCFLTCIYESMITGISQLGCPLKCQYCTKCNANKYSLNTPCEECPYSKYGRLLS